MLFYFILCYYFFITFYNTVTITVLIASISYFGKVYSENVWLNVSGRSRKVHTDNRKFFYYSTMPKTVCRNTVTFPVNKGNTFSYNINIKRSSSSSYVTGCLPDNSHPHRVIGARSLLSVVVFILGAYRIGHLSRIYLFYTVVATNTLVSQFPTSEKPTRSPEIQSLPIFPLFKLDVTQDGVVARSSRLRERPTGQDVK